MSDSSWRGRAKGRGRGAGGTGNRDDDTSHTGVHHHQKGGESRGNRDRDTSDESWDRHYQGDEGRGNRDTRDTDTRDHHHQRQPPSSSQSSSHDYRQQEAGGWGASSSAGGGGSSRDYGHFHSDTRRHDDRDYGHFHSDRRRYDDGGDDAGGWGASSQGDWRSQPPSSSSSSYDARNKDRYDQAPRSPPPPPPSSFSRGARGGRGGRGRGGSKGDARLSSTKPHDQDHNFKRGKELPIDTIELDLIYQGLIYSAHDLHGFFVYFGRLEEQPHGNRFCSFRTHGRITRAGLPESFLAHCENRVADADAGRKEFSLVKVKNIVKEGGGKARVELMLVPERKLLILDLNGVLFNRSPVGDERRIRKEVVKRPGCDAFLDFCFKHFDVACWSCCRKETMELACFGRHEKELIFANHAAHSTNLWPRHSVVSPAKPLFLKYLPRLWSQYDRVAYDQTNTLLIDNHVEKFEGNPLGTCIVVPEYIEGSEPPDTFISMKGELVTHLKKLAQVSDTSAYVMKTTSALFPHEYPEPPRQEGPICRKEVLEAFCGSIYMKSHMPEMTVEWYMERNETPGPRAIQLRRKTLAQVVGKSAPHVICEKSDGKRLFLYVPGHRPGAIFIDRHWDAEALEEKLGSLLSPKGGITLLDGELIVPLVEGGTSSHPRSLYLIFDVIFLDGRDVGVEPLLSIRMELLKTHLAAVGKGRGQEGPIIASFAASDERLIELVPKDFYEIDQLRHLMETMMKTSHPKQGSNGRGGRVANTGGDEFIFDDGKRRSLSDGLVFTPSTLPYYAYQVYKFKIPSRISIDFKVRLPDLRQIQQQRTVPLNLLVNKHDTKFTDLDTEAPARKEGKGEGEAGISTTTSTVLREHMETNNIKECIIECDLSMTGLWKLRTIRADKQQPNSLQTAWNNIEAIAEGLDLEALVHEVEEMRNYGIEPPASATTTTLSTVDSNKKVAAHYDDLQERRWAKAEDALDPRIHNLRRLNNWIKSVLIESACHIGQLPAASTLTNGGHPSSIGKLPNPLATTEQRNNAAAAAGNNKQRKAGSRSKQQQEGFSILDLACGRGGDFKKFVLQGADVYVGVDVSSQSVAECQRRVDDYRQQQASRGKKAVVPSIGLAITHSMLDHDLPALVERAAGGAHGMLPPVMFDVISCQFAIHYAFDSEENLKQLLANVSALLAPGGHFLITSVDSRCLRHHLEQVSPSKDFGNAIYHVTFPDPPPAGLDRMGIRYTFTLSSAVEDCDEYVIHLPTLERLAKEQGLSLVYFENFGSVVKRNLDRYGHLLEPLQVGAVSADEWEAIQLYCVMVFKRI